MVVNSDPVRDGRVRKEARSLTAAGHDVTVFGVRASEDRNADAALGFPVVFPPMPPWIAAGGAVATLRKSAFWYERMRPLADAAIASRPDVIHAHDLDTVGPASRAAAAAGIPCVYDDHEASYVDKLPNYAPADARGPKRAALDAITRRLQKRGEALEREVRARGLAAMITVSEPLADRLTARFGGPRPVVVRNCPALREVPRTDALREKIGAPKDAKLLLYHGTATEGSGIEVVIRALRLLPPHYLFALVGRVWRQEKYEALARDEGVADRVRFVPFVAEDEMFRLVASADVGLVPTEPNSEGNTYGLANKFFESMMAGLPMVAAATPAVEPILARVKAGLLYPAAMPQDPAALAAAARRVCEDAALWASCRETALTAARDEFNWERESEKLVAVYERLAAAPRGPASSRANRV
jgi:glycosyltransferase involved in cell wall biosynthesis